MKRLVWVGMCCSLILGCNRSGPVVRNNDSGAPLGGLTPEQASRVLANVAGRGITLGELASALARMDQFDRIKYQSPERRRELLDEMIDAELLAGEARRLGLDREPETQDAIRIILRDALLAQTREGIPAPADLPDDNVRRYYDNNAEKFSEPERRRVSVIAISDKNIAPRVLQEALRTKTAEEWGELVRKYSRLPQPVAASRTPAELAGDLGIVGPSVTPMGPTL